MKKDIIPEQVDVAIIGSGMGGLISALELSKHGLKVAVFEKRPIPGGYAHSFKRKGFTFDVSLHHIGGLEENGMSYNILKPFNVLEKLAIHKRKNLFVARFDDKIYTLPNTPKEIIEYLGQFFPDEKNGLEKLFQYLEDLKYHVVAPIFFTDFDVPREQMLSFKHIKQPFKDLLETYIQTPKLKAILCQLWMYLGLPPESSAANYSTCIFSSSFIESSFHVDGGGMALSRAIVQSLEETGGKCYCKSGVKEIVVDNGKTTGIELDNGTFVAAKAVISNASPYSTVYDLIQEKKLSKIYRFRVKETMPSMSMYAMYIGLDCLPTSLGIPKTNFFYNKEYDITSAYNNCINGNIEESDWCLTNYKTENSELAPSGCGAISIVEITPPGDWFDYDKETYKQEKEKVKNILLSKYEKQFPGLKNHAKVLEFGTPKTMQRYSGNRLGAIYGFANNIHDPKTKGLGNKTPINNLFFAGSWAQDGGGYEGAMMSGLQAAHFLLGSLGLKRLSIRKSSLLQNNDMDSVVEQDVSVGSAYSNLPYTFMARVYPDDISFHEKIKTTAYLRIIDRARVDLVNQSEEIKKNDFLFKNHFVNVYKLTTFIHHLANIDDLLTIKSDYRKVTSHRAAVDQVVLNEKGELLSETVTEIMFVKKEGGLVELPDIYKEKNNDIIKLDKPKLPKVLFTNDKHFKYEKDFTVFYEDTDAQGIAYNVTYTKLCEKAFWSIRNRVLENGVEFKDISTKRIEIRFLKSAKLKNILTVKCGYRSIDKNNFAIDYRIILKGTKTIFADAYIEYSI